MKALLRLYPAGWRDRYREEMEALLEEVPASPRVVVDLLKGALMAHLDGEKVQPEVVSAGGATAGARPALPRRSRVPPHRLLLALPFLIAATVLLSLAAAQTALLLEGIARFGLERTAVVPMGGRALMYAVPGAVAGLVALFVLRRR
ncbi:hypothetical protein BH20CHL5_BH20CHL5_02740 [soil metagenome]